MPVLWWARDRERERKWMFFTQNEINKHFENDGTSFGLGQRCLASPAEAEAETPTWTTVTSVFFPYYKQISDSQETGYDIIENIGYRKILSHRLLLSHIPNIMAIQSAFCVKFQYPLYISNEDFYFYFYNLFLSIPFFLSVEKLIKIQPWHFIYRFMHGRSKAMSQSTAFNWLNIQSVFCLSFALYRFVSQKFVE